jgi:hypothetical protein
MNYFRYFIIISILLITSCSEKKKEEVTLFGNSFKYTHFRLVSDHDWIEVTGNRVLSFSEDESYMTETISGYRDTESGLCNANFHWLLDQSEGDSYFSDLIEKKEEVDDFDLFAPYFNSDFESSTDIELNSENIDFGPFNFVLFLENNDKNYDCFLYQGQVERPISISLLSSSDMEILEPERSIVYKLVKVK